MKNDKWTESEGGREWSEGGGVRGESKSGRGKGDIGEEGGGVLRRASRWLLAGGRPQDDIRGAHFGCSCWEVLHMGTH